MKEILEKWGWILISQLGPEYDDKEWLLRQQGDNDPFFQAGVLLLLERLAQKGEMDKKNYAYLYDRATQKFSHVGFLQKLWNAGRYKWW